MKKIENKELNFNVLDAISRVGKKLQKSKLSQKALSAVQSDSKKIAEYLGVSQLQASLFCIVFMINYNENSSVDLHDFAEYIDTTPVVALTYYKDLCELSDRGIFACEDDSRRYLISGMDISFKIDYIISEAVIQNVKPEICSEQKQKTVFDLMTFVGKRYFDRYMDSSISHYKIIKEFTRQENEYISLPVVAKIKKAVDIDNRILFYDFCYDRLCRSGEGSDLICTLSDFYGRENLRVYVEEFKRGENILQKMHLVELEKDETLKNSVVNVTDKGLEFILEKDADIYIETISDKELIDHCKIVKKELFYSGETQNQILLLKTSLEKKKFRELQKRLLKENMPQGICALFYGYPGTGKTESVYQIAKATKRKIYHVDISQTKSCWFGESEKLIKDVFEKYKRVCEKCRSKNENIPILLFNEADAVFAKRKDSNSSNVAQTENAIQNILLEQMENLDGILIATTNLENNFDSAFERRFLFKIKFEKPTTENRAKIWRNKIVSLSEIEALHLAENYDFSGGEIDNIVRKSLMKNIISGEKVRIGNIEELCKTEKLNGEVDRRIGFER